MEKLTRHLNAVDESYGQHCCQALVFAVTLLWGAICCLIHAFLPFLFEHQGSRLVKRLHERMVVNRLSPQQRQSGPGR